MNVNNQLNKIYSEMLELIRLINEAMGATGMAITKLGGIQLELQEIRACLNGVAHDVLTNINK